MLLSSVVHNLIRAMRLANLIMNDLSIQVMKWTLTESKSPILLDKILNELSLRCLKLRVRESASKV